MSDKGTPVRSPCIRQCCLDDDDTCLGCFRSLEEIKLWGTIEDPQRTAILQNAERRRATRERRG